MALKPRQLLFVKSYLLTKNATKAAIAAGYSVKTAGKIGSENLQKPALKAEIEKGLAKQTQTLVKNAAEEGFTKEVWLRELRALALSNMDDYLTIERIQPKGKGAIAYEQVRAIPTKDRDPSLGRAIKKISETKNGISIELHSKQAAIETLGKHYEWLKQGLDLNLPPVDSVEVLITMPANGREAPPDKDGADGAA